MKAAIVLSLEGVSAARQAGEINAVLGAVLPALAHAELWLFFRGGVPETIPELHCPVSAIRGIPLVQETSCPESFLTLLLQAADQYPMDLFLFASDGLSRELAARLAYRLGGTSCLQAQDIIPVPGGIEVARPVCGSSLTARFLLEKPPYCLSAVQSPCSPAPMTRLREDDVEILSLNPAVCNWIRTEEAFPDQPGNGLESADLVLVVGMGAGSRETVLLVEKIAAGIGAHLGASRPVVMNAWAGMKCLVGASGTVLSPRVCIAAGVSGAAVFAAGIRGSEFIVAVNTDRHAPIFQIAHVGVVGEMLPFLTELEKIIIQEKGKNKLLDHPASEADE